MESRKRKIGYIIPARYVFAILGSASLAIVYGLRVNLSVAMVGMLNHTAIRIASGKSNSTRNMSSDAECPPYGDGVEVVELDGPFNWPSHVQGIILSCYFWGYIVSQLPGGRLAEMYSAKWVMFFSVFVNAVGTILTPPMCEWHYSGAVVMRILEGIGGGTAFPAIHCLLSKWAPPSERAFISSITYAGSSLGIVISLLMGGLLTAQLGWEWVFYVMGGLTLIWCALWVVLIQDSPSKQKLMTDEERTMIITEFGDTLDSRKNLPVPWRAIFTSRPFLAILIAHTCSNFGWYMLIIQLPFYMKQVLKFNMKQNAMAVSMPFLSFWFFSMFLSRTLDWLRGRSIITTTSARKIGTMIATVIPAACLLGICYIGCNRTGAVALMSLGITGIGGMISGFLTNHIDISPNFAGTLMAITNTVATIPGILVPFFVSYVTHGNQTISAWRIIFFTTIGMYILELIVYTLYGSGKVQPWNKVRDF